jgi:hypothetical protein
MKLRTGIQPWLLFLGIFLAGEDTGSAQRPVVAKDIQISVKQDKAVISYAIPYRKKKSAHLVQLSFVDEKNNVLWPTSVKGSVGPGIESGPRRTIEWDITDDYQQLSSMITPVIFVDGLSREYSNTGGAKNALLSLMIPGLGDYFVADHRIMKFKPYLRTVSSLGLIAMGIYAGNQRYHAEGEYQLFLKPDSWRYEGSDRFFEKYVEGELQYLWFKGDQEVLISLGAVIWLADVIWVFAKGSNNVKFINASRRDSGFRLGYLPGGMSLNYSYLF